MNKIILITGHKASGKTTKLKEILSNYKPEKVAILSYQAFYFFTAKELENFEVVAIEQIAKIEEIEYILQFSLKANFQIIATCQTETVILTEPLLSKINLLNCNDL